jgi:predicted acetyltransferase
VNQDASALRLRPLREDDERAFRDALTVMAAEDFTFGFGYEPGVAWADYRRRVEDHRQGRNLPAGQVPASFLVAEAGGTIVGRTSIRHELDEGLARMGGHIGYCVLPAYRRRGYATEILRQSLVVVRSIGVDRVLVFCDDTNLGSAGAIERCGGKLDAVFVPSPGEPAKRRYWID